MHRMRQDNLLYAVMTIAEADGISRREVLSRGLHEIEWRIAKRMLDNELQAEALEGCKSGKHDTDCFKGC
jgi:hypothetical protein